MPSPYDEFGDNAKGLNEATWRPTHHPTPHHPP